MAFFRAFFLAFLEGHWGPVPGGFLYELCFFSLLSPLFANLWIPLSFFKPGILRFGVVWPDPVFCFYTIRIMELGTGQVLFVEDGRLACAYAASKAAFFLSLSRLCAHLNQMRRKSHVRAETEKEKK